VLDHDNVKADMATVKVEHDFASGAKLVNTSRYGKTKQDYLLTSFMTNANRQHCQPGSHNWTMAHQPDHQGPAQRNPDQPDHADRRLHHRRHQAHRGRRPGTDQREADNYGVALAAAPSLPATSIYHPNPNTPIRPPSPARNGGRTQAPPTPRACTCLTPSSSASSGSSTAAYVWTTTIWTTPSSR
jgi:catecholate siderophore receptor